CRTPFHPQRHRTAPSGQPVLSSPTVCALGPPSLCPKFFRHVEAVRNWTVSWQTHEQIPSDHRDGNAALFYTCDCELPLPNNGGADTTARLPPSSQLVRVGVAPTKGSCWSSLFSSTLS